MKKFIAIITIFLWIAAGGFSARPVWAQDKVTLTVFAAASMQATMEQIAARYTEAKSDLKILYNFDSSGTLKTQIEEGAECDLFISAAKKQMNALEKAGLIDTATRVNLLENKVALVVPEGNPANIHSYEDLGTDKLRAIALGNADVPVGAYSQEILTNMGLWDKLNAESKITFGSNVTEVAMQVREGAVDCGIVYATDAATHKLTVVAEPPAGTLKTPVVYPAAVLAHSAHAAGARAFLNYLRSPEAREIFASVGFAPAK